MDKKIIDNKPIIGGWTATLSNHRKRQSDTFAIRYLLKEMLSIIDILSNHKLFYPTKISLNEWSYYDIKNDVYILADHDDQVLYKKGDILDQKSIEYFFEDALLNINNNVSDIAPFEIICWGEGLVEKQQGKNDRVSDLLRIEASYFIELYISIYTRSNIFLPKDHQELYKLNSKRLSACLKEIDAKEDVKLTPSSVSKYARDNGIINHGFHLDYI